MRPTTTLLVALGALLAAAPTLASNSDFDVRVDRFAVDGNVFGAFDGTPDRVDEFDHDVPTDWFTVNGTVFERDGFLHLASPGDRVADGFGAVPGLPLVISQAYYTYPVERGRGNFSATSWWASTVLHYGDFNHFTVYAYANPVDPYAEFEVVGVALSDPNSVDAPPAYAAVRFVLRFTGGTFQPLETETVRIDPNSISGEVVFRHTYDDPNNTVVTTVSVDGGATFTEPFTPATLFTTTSHAVLLLGADPLASGSVPAPALCSDGRLAAQAVVVLRPRRHIITVNGSVLATPEVARLYDPARAGARLRVEDERLGDALLDLTGTAGASGSGCMPGDGWSRRRRTFTYRNHSDALPPACTPGSAHGLRMLRIDARRAAVGRLGLRAVVRGVTAKPTGRLRVTIVLGSDPATGAAGRCGVETVACTGHGHSLRCS